MSSSTPSGAAADRITTLGQVVAGVSVDWRHPVHRSTKTLPCRLGDGGTDERDEQDRPCHRRCAERELANELLGPAGRAEATSERTLPAPGRATARRRRPGEPNHPSFTQESENHT